MTTGAFGQHPDESLGSGYAWKPPIARAVPEWRRKMVATRRNPASITPIVTAVDNGRMNVMPAGHATLKGQQTTGSADREITSLEWATELSDREADRLESAELYYVTDDATRLALSLAPQLVPDPLRRDEVPAPCGLMVFERPIGTSANKGATVVRNDGVVASRPSVNVETVAVSWGPFRDETMGEDVLWMTFWTPVEKEGVLNAYLRDVGEDDPNPARIEELRVAISELYGPLLWDTEMYCPYETDNSLLHSVHRYEWMCVVRAAWTLMDSPGIIGEETVTQSKPDFRREQRANPARRTPATVRVVNLRRQQTSGAATREEHVSGSQRVYSWRWPVRGHLRWQPYGPERAQRKRIYIEPHIKGPDDKPLKVPGETVHLLDAGARERRRGQA